MTFQQVGLLNDETELELAATRPTRFGRISQNILGGMVLLSCGIAMGRYHPASLRGSSLDLMSEAISTRAEFEAHYNTYTQGLSPAPLSAANSAIYSADTPAGPAELIALQEWYNNVLDGDKNWAQHVMTTAFVNVAVPAPPAVPAKQTPTHPSHHGPSSCLSIQDYTTFGRCFTAATAGRPWAYILHVEEAVQGVSASAMTEEVSALRDFYKFKASNIEKHHFTNDALVHMKAHGMY